MNCTKCHAAIEADSCFCRYCGGAQEEVILPAAAAVSDQAVPQPGSASSPKGLSRGATLSLIIGIIAVFILFQATLGTWSGKGPSDVRASEHAAGLEAEASAAAAAATEAAIAATEAANSAYAAVSKASGHQGNSGGWSYSTDEDKIRGATTYQATTTSTNAIYQGPPYDASTTMNLVIRKSPAQGTDVILTISSGQMMCPSYEGCSGTVRFDDGQAQRISFNGPADNSSDTVFVIGAKSFIAKLEKAKRVVIEKTLYEAGNPQFEFNVSGLKWDH